MVELIFGLYKTICMMICNLLIVAPVLLLFNVFGFEIKVITKRYEKKYLICQINRYYLKKTNNKYEIMMN